jgi:N-acetylmuramoyl-L-alanine amidase
MQHSGKRIIIASRFLLLFSIFFLIVFSAFAQKKQEVLLKFNKQDHLMRIVFEAEEQFVNKAKITTSESQIKIEFSEPFLLTSEKVLPFEIVPAEKSIVVNLREKSEIKIFRLPSPPRLIFDIKSKEIESEKHSEKKPETQQGKEQEKPQAEKLPDKQPLGRVSKVFIIDPGHGGYEFGITGENVNEKNITLNLAMDLSDILMKKSKKVFLSRKADQFLSLSDRISFVNRKAPDIFISLHVSLSNNFIIYSPHFNEQSTNELVDFYSFTSRQKKYIGKSKVLAESIGKAIKEEFNMSVIRREMPLPLLQSTGAPAVLIELPFPKFMAYDQKMRERLAKTIMNGVALYEQQ